ncbi:hypothetical protein WJX72_011817 [[Myrmecia] bisecta]|uniref:Protein kinase domain-containing protein n=1 Tax=[Myrmecia] bisecta TaxID=41462 RepID=A0AAW1PKU9_9CHLO
MSLSGISQDALQGVMGEIELLKNLNHKNIVKYIGSFKTRTHLYIILEYMENGALSSIIKPTKFGAFPESLVAVYIAQVLQGLAYLHEQGVVHRDIKGANILTTKEGLVKLADFGVAAKLGESSDGDESLRQSVVGTPYWMAPEVIEMTSVTAAADIWSVACLAIELLTGQAPYYDLQPMSALFRIVQDEHPPLPVEITPGMQEFLLQCFQKDPQKRPDARTLLRHEWIQHNRKTLRSSWTRTQGIKAMGGKTDAHVSVSSVVERMLQVEVEEAGLPFPEQTTSPNLAPPSRKGLPGARKAEVRDSAMEGSLAPRSSTAQAGSVSRGASLGAATPGRRYGEAGHDLLAWLDDMDRNAAAPVLATSTSPPRNLPPAEAAPEGTMTKHQEAAEIRRLVSSMRSASRTGSLTASSARETPMVDACQQLVALMRDDPERRERYLAEDGAVAIIELLEERSQKVALAALELANALVSGEVHIIESVCLVGMVPAVTRYAAASWPRSLRTQAALFIERLCTASLATAQMLVACQGLPMLVSLVEDNAAEKSQLTQIGLSCIWRVLEVHGQTPLNQLCRLLANAGLPHRLLRALASANQEQQAAHTQESPVAPRPSGSPHAPELRTALLSADSLSTGDDSTRAGSHGGPSTATSAPRHTPLGSGMAGLMPGSKPSTLGRQVSANSDGELGGHRRAASWAGPGGDQLPATMDKISNLLLVMSHADSSVKNQMCRRDTLLLLFNVLPDLEPTIMLKGLKCIKHLTMDPSTLQLLQDAGSIPALLPYLAGGSAAAAVEALQGLYNLCKISRSRQEAAACAGLVPHLAKLALQTPPQPQGSSPAGDAVSRLATLRPLAVSLLCGMAHSTSRTRAELWAHNGLDILLHLLKEEAWQGVALDALATWLTEDTVRLEPRLAQRDAVQRFVSLFAAHSAPEDSEALDRLLGPFLRIMKRSPRITVEVAQAGLPAVLVELLKAASALTALSLLQMVRCMYEHHPRPKDLLVKTALVEQLRRLAAGVRTHQAVLVRKQAQNLLDAFQINCVL